MSSDEVFFKAADQADLADVNRRVTHRMGDADLQDLARRIAHVHRQIVAPSSGVSTLTMAERRAMRDRIIAAMTGEQDSPFPNDKSKPDAALIEIANLLAGLTDEVHGSVTKASEKLVKYGSPGMTALAQRIADLGKVVDAFAARQAADRPARFQTGGVQKADAARQELNKALQNGKPASRD